jgi:hypothetical protein
MSQSMITKAQSNHKASTKAWPIPSHFHLNHLIKRGSQTACNHKLGYHDSCTVCKGSILYPRVVISSLAKLHFAILTLPLVYGLEITTCCYKGLLQEYVMLCYSPDKRSLLAVLRFQAQTSPLAPCGSGSSQSMSQRLITKYGTIPTLNRAWHTTYSIPN